MAKGGAKKANKMLEQSQQDFRRFGGTQEGRSAEAYGYGTGIRDYVTDKYKSMLEGYGGDGGGGGGGGGQDEFSQDWETIRRTGGFNPEQVEALRGYGVPKNFAMTGGWSEPEMSNFRARTTASVPGFFDAMKRNLSQRQAISGGYGPGFDAAGVALAREQARGGAAAALESEGALQSSIREGKKWGATTSSDMESRIFGNQKEALAHLEAKKQAAMARGDAQSARAFGEQMAILSGLRGIRGETGAETAYDDLALRGYGGGLSAAGQYAQANPNVSIWDRIAQIGGAATGLVPLFGGGKKKPPAEVPYS